MTANVFENEVLTMLRSSFRNLIEAIDLDMILDMEECSLDFRLWPENELLETSRYDMDNENKVRLSSRRVVQTLLTYALDPPPPKCSPQDNRVKKYPKLSVQILVSVPSVLKVLAEDEDLMASFFARLLGGGVPENSSPEAASYSSVGNGTGSDEECYVSSESSDVSPKLREKKDGTNEKLVSQTKHALTLSSPPWLDDERSNHFNKILEALLEYQKGTALLTFVRNYAFSRLPYCEDMDEPTTLLHALVRGIHLRSITELLLKMLSTGISLRLFSYSYAGVEAYEDEREASNLDEESTWSRAYLRFPFEEEVEPEATTYSVDSDVEEEESQVLQVGSTNPSSKREQTLEWLFQSDNCIRLVRILLHRFIENSTNVTEPGNAVEVLRAISRVLSRLAIVNLRLTDEMDSSQEVVILHDKSKGDLSSASSSQPMDGKPLSSLEKKQDYRKLEPEAHVIVDHMLHMLYKAYDRLFMEWDSSKRMEFIARHSQFLAGVHFLFGAATKVLAAFLDIRLELNNWGELPPLISVLLKYVEFAVNMLQIAPQQPLLYLGSLSENRITTSWDRPSSSWLGLHRLQLVKFFTALVGVPHIDVQSALVQAEVIAPIIQLLFDYPNHNVLHSEIERLVIAIIRGNTDYELRQNLLDVLVPKIYQVAVDRREGKIAPWLSYMGHVKRLAEELISASATQPSLCQMLKRNSWWSTFMTVNNNNNYNNMSTIVVGQSKETSSFVDEERNETLDSSSSLV
ncbi:hypothetical protein Gasu2_30040 [Galdieria sulphuraria]|nr:hypothetical protein Gasu2_30040 [Galdieria sulphuraria]